MCERMAGGASLVSLLKEPGSIDSHTFYSWMDASEEKLQKYTRATAARAERVFEEIMTIADDSSSDKYINEQGKEAVNHETIQRDRLRVDSRKWMLSKMMPKKYGDKLDLTSDNEKLEGSVIILPSNTRESTDEDDLLK